MALKENYRELLIDAVVRVAAREGLDRTTTKLIAAEVPCNEVYIYRNFGSKDALLQAAFSRTDLRFVQTVLKNLDVMDAPGQPLEQRCRALWEPVWRFCLAQPDDIRFYLRYYYSAQFLASAHELHHRNYQQLQARLGGGGFTAAVLLCQGDAAQQGPAGIVAVAGMGGQAEMVVGDCGVRAVRQALGQPDRQRRVLDRFLEAL